jgi:hypothetical protein
MGYINSDRGFYHPENRKVIFVGDYIDRGPAIPETVEIVRTMVDHNNAIALMGNHELNAILFNMKDENGKFLRPHTQKNIDQHAKTQYQFENNSASYDEMISWFKTLPLYFEDKYLRAIHAFWKTAMVDDLTENHLNSDLSLNNSFWADAGNKETNLFHLTDNLLKGKEVPLPDGFSFKDKGGISELIPGLNGGIHQLEKPSENGELRAWELNYLMNPFLINITILKNTQKIKNLYLWDITG